MHGIGGAFSSIFNYYARLLDETNGVREELVEETSSEEMMDNLHAEVIESDSREL